jgi:hypothetical protein
VLPCQRGNPKIVLRNGLAGYAELVTDVSIDTTGFGSNGEDDGTAFQFIKPTLASGAKTGSLHSITIFA